MPRRRRRQPVGHLTAEELRIHRELTYLRAAGSVTARGRKNGNNRQAKRRSERRIAERFQKLQELR